MIITNGMMCELVKFSSSITRSHKWTLCKANGFSSYKVVFLYKNLSAYDKGRERRIGNPRVYILEKEIYIFG
jgi:hypothetical protein